MLFLQVGLYAATPNNIQPKNNQSKNIQPNSTQPGNSPSLKINSDRLKANEEIPDLTLGRVLGRPPIVIGLHLEGLEVGFMALRKEKNFEEVEKFVQLWKQGKEEEAYVKADKFLTQNTSSPFAEWIHFFKGDMMFLLQEKRENPQYNLAVEDYELALRRYPLSSFVERGLFQMALAQLRSNLFQESQQTVKRASNEFGNGILAPLFILMDGEANLLSKNFDAALSSYSLVIRRFPKSQAAVDAAFRKAYLHFVEGEFKEALNTYEDLDRYHSQVLQLLRMQTEASAENKFVDRVIYAETLYLNGRYADASGLFQTLGNLFPKDPRASLIWLRFGDTYLRRQMISSAKSIYQFVLKEFPNSVDAQAWARIKLADLYWLTGSIEAQSQNRALLEKAFVVAEKIQPEYSSLALAKLGQFLLLNGNYAKAQVVLDQYKEAFPKADQINWVNRKSTELLEMEILDHYKAGDFLAALTRYITHEQAGATSFKNVNVLLKLSEAAKELELLDKSSEILNQIIYLEGSADVRQVALLRLIDNLIIQKKFDRASERLRRFNFAYPRTTYQYLYDKAWGDIYRGRNNSAKSLEHYERALQTLSPNENRTIEMRQILLYLGELYESEGLPLKAVEAYEAYLKIYEKPEVVATRGIPTTPKDIYQIKVSHYRIADLFFNSRDYVKALSAYKRINDKIKEEPFLSHARYRIGECYLALDDRAAALDAFKEVKSSDPKSVWLRAAQAYIAGVQMEVKYGIRIFN